MGSHRGERFCGRCDKCSRKDFSERSAALSGTHAAGYHDTALIRSELEDAGFSRVVIETRAEQSRASSPRLPAVAYCQGTVLRNEIEARGAGKLEAATSYAASAIADRHGGGEVAAKIQAHVIVAVA